MSESPCKMALKTHWQLTLSVLGVNSRTKSFTADAQISQSAGDEQVVIKICQSRKVKTFRIQDSPRDQEALLDAKCPLGCEMF